MADVERNTTHAAPSRRQFMKSSSAVVAGGALAGSLGIARSAHAAGNDTIKVGVIGCGGRGRGAADNILTADGTGVKLVAVADAFQGQIDNCLRRLTRAHGERVDVPPERQFAGLDGYQKVLASDCDLVILATPPGFRPLHFEAAIEAGKHVFAEKPVAVDAPGIRRFLAAGEKATEKGLGVGIGLQRRHDPAYQLAVRRLHDGMIGDIPLTRVYWNSGGVWVRSRSEFFKAFNREPNELEYQVYNWYYFNWLCGDHITEQHIHNLDVSNWVKQMLPVEANGMGGREWRTGPDHGQIFDHHFVEFTYPDGSRMMSQCRHIAGCWSAVEEGIHGTNGSAFLSQGRQCAVKIGSEDLVCEGEKVDSYVQEHIDLLASIRAGTPYNEAEYGATSTMTAILGRMATYCGDIVTWDEAIQSEIELAPSLPYGWDAEPPVMPDEEGRYPVPVPGETQVV